MKIVEFQKWTHLFEIHSPKVYEDEVISFYVGLFVVDRDTLYLKMYGKYFIMNEETLGEIFDVPTDGLKTVEGTGSLILRS